MSDTPRTEALFARVPAIADVYNFGCALERDLAKAQAQCAELRSEVEKAWREGFDSGKRLPSFKAQEYTNSRARKVATGKAVT